jgi:hypothetical protein
MIRDELLYEAKHRPEEPSLPEKQEAAATEKSADARAGD